MSWMKVYCEPAIIASWLIFIDHSPSDRIYRISGLIWVSWEADGSAIVKWKTHSIALPELQRWQALDSNNEFKHEFKALLFVLCKMVAYSQRPK